MDRARCRMLFLVGGTFLGVVYLPLPAAPVPRVDWWLEIEGQPGERIFVSVPGGDVRKARAPKAAKAGGIPSPDGKWVARTTHCPDPPGQPFDIRHVCYDLTVHPTGRPDDVAALGPVAQSDTVAWTPDSKRVVFLAYRDGWRACSANPDGSDVQLLTQSRKYSERPDSLSVLPDGRALHFAPRKPLPLKFGSGCTVHSNSGEVVISDGVRDRVLCRDTVVSKLSSSPDGTRVAYLTGVPLQTVLVVHDLLRDRTDRVSLGGLRPGWYCSCSYVVWRPDGRAAAVGFSTWDLLCGLEVDDEQLRHVAIISLGAEGIDTQLIRFPPWPDTPEQKGGIGYHLGRWVTGVEVERDGRGLVPVTP